MFYVLIAILLGAATAGGFTLGWWCRHWSGAPDTDGLKGKAAVAPSAASADAAAHREQEAREQHAKTILQQVHALTAKVKAQVGEHNSRVQEINDELTNADGSDIDGIMASVARLVETNANMQQQLASAEHRLAEQSRQIESHVSEARTDALTGINNRRAFDEELLRCQEDYERSQQPASVMMLDVDFFKKFNDTHGHKAGDEVLRHVAQTLKQSLASNDVVCRYGGEEFAVIFRDTSLAEATEAAERARSAIGDAEIVFEGKKLQVTASSGLAEFGPNDTYETVLERADGALYASKKAGRDQGHLHDGTGFQKVETNESRRARQMENPAVKSGDQRTEAIGATSPNKSNSSDHLVLSSVEATGAASQRDEVTGLPLHKPFYAELDRKLTEWHEGGPGVSIMMVQLDWFNKLRKQHGEEVVNVVLRALAQFLKATVRDTDNLARFDEESFAVMLPGVALEETTAVAQRLEQTVNRCQFTHGGKNVSLSLSIGITQATRDDNAGRLLLRAKVAKNNAANRGGNQVYVHDGERLRPAAVGSAAGMLDDCRR